MTTATRRRKPPVALDPVQAYAEAVVAGRYVVGPLVRLACKRHLADRVHGPSRGLVWDEAASAKAIGFFENVLKLHEGEHEGRPFTLEPWQQFIIGSLFGWKGEDGYRRFRTAYVEAGKGNGKTPMIAGIGLYGLCADDEHGAEVYTAGTTRDQANYILNDAKNMIAKSPLLASRLTDTKQNIAYMRRGSFMRPVSSEARTLDQKRVHMALIDEIHEHPNDIVVNKMRAGTKGRRQPMIVEITNSGYDRHSICWQHHEYSRQILEGVIDNDAWFAYVCGLDEGDDFLHDEGCWPKANPNMGVSITRKYIREQVDEALGMPSKQSIVLRLNGCVWTESETRWLSLDRWNEGSGDVDPGALVGRECYGGLDLSTVLDLSAFVLLFPAKVEDEPDDVMAFFWVPSENVRQRALRDRVPYDVWIRQGWITPTPGNVIDYDFIRAELNELASVYTIKEIAIDPWNSVQLAIQLRETDGINVVDHRQGYLSMSAPSKEVERKVQSGRYRHGGNPVLRWCVSNVVIDTDPAGNIKPSKEKSTEKIDGVTGLVMAESGHIRATQPGGPSIYATRGLRTL